MAITEGTLLQISVNYTLYLQQMMNVWTYEVGGTFSGITAGAVANAYWQRVKASYRGLISTDFGAAFSKVVVADASDPTGDYGEYSIPSSERTGTRSTSSSNGMPPFVAAGVRLAVATRVTRPGQKRFPGLMESDSAGENVDPGFITLVNAIMDAATVSVTLGSPALGMDLNPIVIKRDPATGSVLATEPVTGYTVNTRSTSQVSRKVGRGM